MKLCITATGNTLEASTDMSFGRAPWFMLVNTDTLDYEAIENSGVNARQGAGIAAAQMIHSRGADALLTGRVGPKAQAALESCGIPVYEGLAGSTVREAVSRFKEGVYGNPGQAPAPAGPGAVGNSGTGGGRGTGAGMNRGSGSGVNQGAGAGMGNRSGSGMNRGGSGAGMGKRPGSGLNRGSGGRCRGGQGSGRRGGM